MPQIPVVEGPSVQPDKLPTPYRDASVPENAFGVGLAHEGLRAGAALTAHSNVLADEAQRANTTRVSVELANYQGALTEISDRAQMRKGQEAPGAASDAVAEAMELAQDYSSRLANDAQRDLFVPRVKSSLAGTYAALMRHEGEQANALAKDAAVSLLASAGEMAARNWTQPEIVTNSVKQAEDAARSDPEFSAMSEEGQAVYLANAKSSVYANIMRAQTTAGNHAAFIKTYQDHEGDLNAKDHAVFAKAYEETNDLSTAVSTADAIWKKANGDLSTSLDEAAQITDPKLRLDVEGRVKQLASDEHSATEEAERADQDEGWGIYYDKGTPDALPRPLYARLHERQPLVLKAMRDDMEQKARMRVTADKGEFAPDLEAIGKWMKLSPAEQAMPEHDPRLELQGKASAATIIRFYEKVSDTLNQQRGVNDRGAALKGPPVLTQTVNDRIVAMSRQQNMDDINTGALNEYVWNKVNEYQDLNGTKPDSKTMDSIMDSALIDGERKTKELWYHRDIRQFEAGRTGDFTPFGGPAVVPVTPGVAPADATRIEGILKSAGRPSDPASILRYYNKEQSLKAKP